MLLAILYVCLLILYAIGLLTDFPFQADHSYLNWTNSLIAFGIISICNRLDKLIERKND